MTPDEMDLRDTARALAWLYRLLDDRKFAPPPPKDSRIMRPTPGPADPVPLWLVDAEDRLLEERKEVDENGYPLPLAQVVPGGLRNMVIDAAEHIGTHPEQRDGAALCDFVGWHAHPIALAFPAAADLLDLMKQQATWLAARLTPRADTNRVREAARTVTDLYTAADAAALASAATGKDIDRKQVTYWARRANGGITAHLASDGTSMYKLSEVIELAETYKDKRKKSG